MPYQSMGMFQQQRQIQTMAPQMRHSLEILQLPIMELRAAIQKEMEQNPVIEDVTSAQELVADTTSDSPDEIAEMSAASLSEARSREPTDSEVTGGDDDGDDDAPKPGKDARDPELDFEKDTLRGLSDVEGDYLFDNDTPEPTRSQEAESRRQYMFDSLTQPVSLQMRLLGQLVASGLSKADVDIGETIIGALNDDGFLEMSVEDISFQTGASKDDVERVLRIVQSFEPPGIAARDARECLMLQLDALEPSHDREVAKAIVRDHLKALSRKDFSAIATALAMDQDEVRAGAKLILSLNPSPASAVEGRTAEYITPEVFVERGKKGAWTVRLDDDSLPRIHISGQYASMLDSPEVKGETKSYIRDRMRAGQFLIRSIEQRQQTILKISTAIVEAQKDFLDRGVAYLHPMTMSEVAAKVGMHETTVSRAVSNKYMKTPRGVFELKYFFTAAIKTASGKALSNKTVQDRIAAMIRAESPESPLSDQAIAEMLTAEGVKIARRTVVKYRDKMRIPPSHLRRRA